MTFTEDELAYLDSQTLGRLATVQSDGTPQVSPVGFSYNREFDTIDIAGYSMSSSQKFRNVAHDRRVAFVVDDIASTQPWRVRCLEIRGVADAVPDPGEPAPGSDSSIIRIHPRRIISFGIVPSDQEPHLLTPNKRDVA
jgi:pyridoxamine 5'-phosphate oxidase family protein